MVDVLKKVIQCKSEALQRGDPSHAACRSEVILALLALEASSYTDAMVSLISAVSLVSELAGKPITVIPGKSQ